MTDREKWIQVAQTYVRATVLLDDVGVLLRELGADETDKVMFRASDDMTAALAACLPDEAKLLGMAAAVAAIVARQRD
jgi:hypothetical protein